MISTTWRKMVHGPNNNPLGDRVIGSQAPFGGGLLLNLAGEGCMREGKFLWLYPHSNAF